MVRVSALPYGEGKCKESLMSTPRTYPEGIPCWVDIEAVDLEEAARFTASSSDGRSWKSTRSLDISLRNTTGKMQQGLVNGRSTTQ
jgi:hypothetical protein